MGAVDQCSKYWEAWDCPAPPDVSRDRRGAVLSTWVEMVTMSRKIGGGLGIIRP